MKLENVILCFRKETKMEDEDFKKIKVNFLNQMLDGHLIPVEEAFVAMEPESKPKYENGEVNPKPYQNPVVKELSDRFREDVKNFYIDWYDEHILEHMDQDSLRRLFETMRRELAIPKDVDVFEHMLNVEKK
mgnify:CR=1 FL=1|tara:strand:+ start:3194 stop:3589 length:396 start_codon:yes stop_codon:yes gene_type:complete